MSFVSLSYRGEALIFSCGASETSCCFHTVSPESFSEDSPELEKARQEWEALENLQPGEQLSTPTPRGAEGGLMWCEAALLTLFLDLGLSSP